MDKFLSKTLLKLCTILPISLYQLQFIKYVINYMPN